MKLLFLDIDGVMNSLQSAHMHLTAGRYYNDFCPNAAAMLRWVLSTLPDLHIVISSSWRNNPERMELLEHLFHESGLDWGRVLGTIGNENESEKRPRILIIKDWIKKNALPDLDVFLLEKYEVESFVIVDDDKEGLGKFENLFDLDIPYEIVYTHEEIGFNLFSALEILHFFTHRSRKEILKDLPVFDYQLE